MKNWIKAIRIFFIVTIVFSGIVNSSPLGEGGGIPPGFVNHGGRVAPSGGFVGSPVTPIPGSGTGALGHRGPGGPGGPGDPAGPGGPGGLGSAPALAPVPVRPVGGFGGRGGHGRDVEDYGPPQPYNFQYSVNDALTGAAFNQHEDSDGNVVKGGYSVQLPDGRNQIVKYNADGSGFNAEVQYQGEPTYPTFPAASSGNRNAGGFTGSGGFTNHGGATNAVGSSSNAEVASEGFSDVDGDVGDASAGFIGPSGDTGSASSGFAGGNAIGGANGFRSSKYGK